MKKLVIISTLFCVLSAAAQAAQGYVTTRSNLRAGPDINYPVVDHLQAGERVEILGCIRGYGWCEISSRSDRGWIAAAYLQAVHYKKRVRIVEAAPVVHIPVITFSVGSYWDRYYHDRPFYRDRSRWVHDDDRHDRDDRRDHDRGRGNDWKNDNNDWRGYDNNRSHRDKRREGRW